jgi:hypothetical protein
MAGSTPTGFRHILRNQLFSSFNLFQWECLFQLKVFRFSPSHHAGSDEGLAIFRKSDSKGGKLRAKKDDTKTFRKWAKDSGGGRPRRKKGKKE